MRTVVIALFVTALIVGLWLITKHPDRAEPTIDRVRFDLAPVTPDDSDVRAGDVSTTVARDEAAANGDQRTETPGPAMRSPYQQPEFHDTLVRYLVKSGLSAQDSESAVDTAIDGLIDCSAAASDFGAEGRTALGICNRNVLQEGGLNRAIVLTALNDSVRSLARRRAMERSAGQ